MNGEGSAVGPQTLSPALRPRVHIRSFGCQMNVYDATRMIDLLAPEGYEESQSAADADVIILNTCHIRELADDKLFSELGRLRVLKQERAAAGTAPLLAVAGCVAQAQGQEILRRQSAVDLVVGPQAYHRLPQLVARARARSGVVDTEFPVEDKFAHLPAPAAQKTRDRGVSAFITIQEGCDKFCTFCVVPYTRGAEHSRSVVEIMEEARRLTDAGVREITLLGQNVNAWQGPDERGRLHGLAQLLEALAALPGLVRLRYMTSHPNDMSDDLVAAHRDLPALMPFLHLPVQSGSDRILAAMNRRHTADDYRQRVAQLRAVQPAMAFSSDFIVGFPGESDEDFEDTLRLVDDIGYASTFFFKYSPRPGTPGADMPDQIPEPVRKERLARLEARVEAQRHAFNRAKIGTVVDVLVEKPGRHPGQMTGKSPWLQPVFFEGPPELAGQIVPVRITGVTGNSLAGSQEHDAGRAS